VFKLIRGFIFAALKKFSQLDSTQISENLVLIDQPKDKNLGDLYTNAAMVFSKTLGTPPKILAEVIREAVSKSEDVVAISIAGPGFVNFKLKDSAWQRVIDEIIQKGKNYGYTNVVAEGTLINVEFVSANPTGPLHTGHARNAVFGSVVVNLLKRIGYDVTAEFYINDRGGQIKSLARSLYLRYKEILGVEVSEKKDFKSGMYCGEYIKDLAKKLIEVYQDSFLNKCESEWVEPLSEFSLGEMLKDIKKDLALIGVMMDKYTSEAELCKQGMIEEAVAILEKYDDIYEGILPKPKKIGDEEEWEETPQTLFRSTKYEDDIDRAVKKSDGEWTYFAGDLAYHLDKIKRGYRKMVTILGADHNGYLKRLKAAVRALSGGEADIDIRLYQLVNFLENGSPIKMSKRAGNFITLKEVVEKVGKDVTRYMMISRHHDVMIDFDFAKAIEQSMSNPLFYVQYAYARICSVFRNYESKFGKLKEEELLNCDKTVLSDESEIILMQSLAFWPDQVKSAAIALEPHRIPSYLQNIAALFHSLWNKGKSNTELRFIDSDNLKDTMARLSLLFATKNVIEDGFDIIGITPMTEMR
jgi:arginyl-tRNA synthetase